MLVVTFKSMRVKFGNKKKLMITKLKDSKSGFNLTD